MGPGELDIIAPLIFGVILTVTVAGTILLKPLSHLNGGRQVIGHVGIDAKDCSFSHGLPCHGNGPQVLIGTQTPSKLNGLEAMGHCLLTLVSRDRGRLEAGCPIGRDIGSVGP